MAIWIFIGVIAGSWILYQVLRSYYPLFCFLLYSSIFLLIIGYYFMQFPPILLIPRMVVEWLGVFLISGPILVPFLRMSLGLSLGMMDASERLSSGLTDSPSWRGYKKDRTGHISRRTLADDLSNRDKDY